MDCSLPGSSVHGISQARILEGIATPFSKGSSWPKDQTWGSRTGTQILYHLTHQVPGEAFNSSSILPGSHYLDSCSPAGHVGNTVMWADILRVLFGSGGRCLGFCLWLKNEKGDSVLGPERRPWKIGSMGGKTWPPWSRSDCCPVLIIGFDSNAWRKKLELPCPGKKPYAQQRRTICRAITCSRVVARHLEEEATAKKKKKYKFLWSSLLLEDLWELLEMTGGSFGESVDILHTCGWDLRAHGEVGKHSRV